MLIGEWIVDKGDEASIRTDTFKFEGFVYNFITAFVDVAAGLDALYVNRNGNGA
jgi:hypothetical protein